MHLIGFPELEAGNVPLLNSADAACECVHTPGIVSSLLGRVHWDDKLQLSEEIMWIL